MELVKPKPNIAIISLDTPNRLQSGAIEWACDFRVEGCGAGHYLIQQVTIKTKKFMSAGGVFVAQQMEPDVTNYWESWKIIGGGALVLGVTDKDSFLSRNSCDAYEIPPPPSGIRKIEYVVGSLCVYKGPLTTDFKSNSEETHAGPLPSTATMPNMWPGHSTPFHNMYVCHKEDGSTIVATLIDKNFKLFEFDNQNQITQIIGKTASEIVYYFRDTNGDGRP